MFPPKNIFIISYKLKKEIGNDKNHLLYFFNLIYTFSMPFFDESKKQKNKKKSLFWKTT